MYDNAVNHELVNHSSPECYLCFNPSFSFLHVCVPAKVMETMADLPGNGLGEVGRKKASLYVVTSKLHIVIK